MPVAYNEQSGEAVMLTPEGQWSPTRIAENPDTGERMAWDGQQWQSVYKPGMLARAGRAVKNFVTGDNRREFDLPELLDAPEFKQTGVRALPSFMYSTPAPSMAAERDKIGAAMAITPGVKAQTDISIDALRKADPAVAQKADKFGNPIVTFKGKDYYVNRPGASAADAVTTAGQVAMYMPASRLGMAAGSTLLGTALGGGGAAATSVASDAIAQSMGSQQPVDLPRAGVAAAGGAVERLAGPAFDRVAQWVRSRMGASQVLDPATGGLTVRARAALREAGIDPDAVGDDFAAEFARRARAMPDDPAMAARLAEAESLPVPVRMTQGQVSGLPDEQMFENLAEKGAYGTGARDVMRGARADTREGLAGNIQAIQRQVGGGAAGVAQPGQGAQRTQATLSGMRQAERETADMAYDAARESAAAIDPQPVAAVARTARERVLADHDLVALPRTTRLLDQLDGLTTPAADGAVPSPVAVRQLFEWRARATNARSAGGEEAVALRKAIGEVDAFLERAADEAIVSGDEASIDLFRSAISRYREFAARFKGRDLVQRLTDMDARAGTRQLVVPPDQAADVIFGSSKLFGGTNTARDLGHLRDILGADSPQWLQLREEAWMRLVRAGEGAINPTTSLPEFSGVKFAKAVDSAVADDAAIMRTLFSPEELGLIQQFKRVAARATGTVKGGDNFSNTTPAAANIVQNLIGRFFTSESSAQRMLMIPLVRSLYQGGMGLRAVAAQTPRAALRGPPAAVLAPAGAIAASRPTNEGGRANAGTSP